MEEHTIRVDSAKWPTLDIPAGISIVGDQLTVSAGSWPDFGGAVIALSPMALTLDPSDGYLHLGRDGSIYLSAESLPYGPDLPEADLLAWKQEGQWHIKKLEII